MLNFESMPNDDIVQFNKSKVSLENLVNNKLYNYQNCKFGDRIYYDNVYGYNFIEGEYIGYCIIDSKRKKDGYPVFIYKDSIDSITFNNAKKEISKLTHIDDKFKSFHIPDNNELKLAASCGYQFSSTKSYWSSSKVIGYDDLCVFFYIEYAYNDKKLQYLKFSSTNKDEDEGDLIIFFNPFKNEKINENHLLQFDYNDNIEFNKSNRVQSNIQKNILEELFLNTQVGDLLYYNKQINRYKISNVKIRKNGYRLIGKCCINAKDSYDNHPKFCALKLIRRVSWLDFNDKSAEYFSLSRLGAIINDDGWHNTKSLENLLNFNGWSSLAIDMCKQSNINYYIPSIFEIKMANNYDFIKDGIYMSSSQTNTWQNHCFHVSTKYCSVEEYAGINTPVSLLPFIHVTSDKLSND